MLVVGAEVHGRRDVAAAHRSADVLVLLQADVQSQLEAVRAAVVARVVDELQRVQRAQVADRERLGQRDRRQPGAELQPAGVRRRRDEVEREVVAADDELVHEVRRRVPAPVGGDVPGIAERVHEARLPGEGRRAAVDLVADRVLLALGVADERVVLRVEDVVDLEREVVLLFLLERRRTCSRRC